MNNLDKCGKCACVCVFICVCVYVLSLFAYVLFVLCVYMNVWVRDKCGCVCAVKMGLVQSSTDKRKKDNIGL